MAKTGKYSLKERLNIEELYDTFMGLPQRQQMLAGGGIALVLLLLLVVPVTCAGSRLSKLEKQIESHEKNVSKVLSKIDEYNDLKGRLKNVEAKIRPKSQVQLRTKIETLATQSGITNNIDSLKEKSNPGEDFEELIVDVRISKLSLSQILEFIYGMESQSDLSLKVNRLQLKPRYDNRQLFDADFEVSTYVSKEGET
jgi:type II secretory pathway component PulM